MNPSRYTSPVKFVEPPEYVTRCTLTMNPPVLLIGFRQPDVACVPIETAVVLLNAKTRLSPKKLRFTLSSWAVTMLVQVGLAIDGSVFPEHEKSPFIAM